MTAMSDSERAFFTTIPHGAQDYGTADAYALERESALRAAVRATSGGDDIFDVARSMLTSGLYEEAGEW